MKFLSLLAASMIATLAFAAPNIPTTKICNIDGSCFDMPIVGQGSCCGAYNISSWLSQGGIHIDTSCDYGSQPTIASAIAASGIPRNQLWITSKLNVESISTNMTQALYEQVLIPLNTTYVDLLLIHHAGRWETDNYGRPPCFDPSQAGPTGPGSYYPCRLLVPAAFEALRAQGLIRTWGVSNWNVRDLQQMKAAYGYYPPINQIETHPYWNNREVVSFCNKNNILVEAYAPIGDGTRTNMISDPGLIPIANAHGMSVGQTVLTWELQVGADIVIPRSATPSHQAENLALFSPWNPLNETEIAAIASIKTNWTKAYHTDCQPWC